MKKLIIGVNDLATVNPDLAKEWNYEKNNNFKPTDITAGSSKKAWWKCTKGHEWYSNISSRNRGVGCPYCSNHKILYGFNDLATTNPELAKEWNYEKNNNLKPTDITAGSEKKVWWKCDKGHEWIAIIASRNRGNNCPYCSNHKTLKNFNSLATINPELATQWHPTKNKNLKPTDISANNNKKVWWLGKCGHEWNATIGSRNQGANCPYCSNKKTLKGFNDLSTINPELAAQWHPTKNGNLKPTAVTVNSGKKIWWVCKQGHEWKAEIKTRNRGNNCPYCSNQITMAKFNDLATTHPELAKQWHPVKNGDKQPCNYTYGSHEKVWWICEQGHEWKVDINTRTKHNCPYCSGRLPIIGKNDFQTMNPKLIQEWHPTKNGNLKPTDIATNSGKKIWWICSSCGYEWQTAAVDRSSGHGCPYCFKNSSKRHEYFETKFLFKINKENYFGAKCLTCNKQFIATPKEMLKHQKQHEKIGEKYVNNK